MNNVITANLTMPTSATLDSDIRRYFSNLADENVKSEAVAFYKKIRNKPTSTLIRYENVLAPKSILDGFSYMCDARRVARLYAVSRVLDEREEDN